MGMAKYDRLLFILNLLRSRKNLTAAHLARECGVTERSIYRDLIALSEANVPIYFDRGYKLASDNFLPPLNFDLREYQCLKTALESSPLAEMKQYRQVLQQIRVKVEASLSQTVKARRPYQPVTTHIDIETTMQSEAVERYFADIEAAIASGTRLEIEYESVESGRVTRTIEPDFIVFRGHAFYTVAFCCLRRDFRTFRLDRIRSLTKLSATFYHESPPDPEHYFDDSWGLFRGRLTDITVRFTGAAARVVLLSRHHPTEQITECNDGSVLYRVRVRGTREFCRWVLGFGGEAEVISPDEIRRYVAGEARKMSATYAT